MPVGKVYRKKNRKPPDLENPISGAVGSVSLLPDSGRFRRPDQAISNQENSTKGGSCFPQQSEVKQPAISPVSGVVEFDSSGQQTKITGAAKSPEITFPDTWSSLFSAVQPIQAVNSAPAPSLVHTSELPEGPLSSNYNDNTLQQNASPTLQQDPQLEKDGDNNGNLESKKNYIDNHGDVHLQFDDGEPTVKSPKSFASLFDKAAKLMRGKDKLTYYPPNISELGTRRAYIPDELIKQQSANWGLTLYGYFIGKRPAFPFVQFHARRLWRQFDLGEVILNDQGYFFFKFKSEQGLLSVLENGPWLFNGIPIFTQRWQASVWLDRPKPTSVPLWVNIYDLPIDLWDYDILSYIASVVGIPIAVDRYTADMCEQKTGRASFARVLIELCAEYEIPTYADAIILGNLRRFRLEFNWKPARCSACKVFGHDFACCTARPRTVEEMQKQAAEAPKHPIASTSASKDDGFVQPKRRKRKPKVIPVRVGPKPQVKVAPIQGTKTQGTSRVIPKLKNRGTYLPKPNDEGNETTDDPPPPSPSPQTIPSPQVLTTPNTPVEVARNRFEVLSTGSLHEDTFHADEATKKEKQEIQDLMAKGIPPSDAEFHTWSKQKQGYCLRVWKGLLAMHNLSYTRDIIQESPDDDDDDGSESECEIQSDDTGMAQFMKIDSI